MVEKLQTIQDTCLQVQESMDVVASLFERVEKLVSVCGNNIVAYIYYNFIDHYPHKIVPGLREKSSKKLSNGDNWKEHCSVFSVQWLVLSSTHHFFTFWQMIYCSLQTKANKGAVLWQGNRTMPL